LPGKKSIRLKTSDGTTELMPPKWNAIGTFVPSRRSRCRPAPNRGRSAAPKGPGAARRRACSPRRGGIPVRAGNARDFAPVDRPPGDLAGGSLALDLDVLHACLRRRSAQPIDGAQRPRPRRSSRCCSRARSPAPRA
jgi:hypothetical protein